MSVLEKRIYKKLIKKHVDDVVDAFKAEQVDSLQTLALLGTAEVMALLKNAGVKTEACGIGTVAKMLNTAQQSAAAKAPGGGAESKAEAGVSDEAMAAGDDVDLAEDVAEVKISTEQLRQQLEQLGWSTSQNAVTLLLLVLVMAGLFVFVSLGATAFSQSQTVSSLIGTISSAAITLGVALGGKQKYDASADDTAGAGGMAEIVAKQLAAKFAAWRSKDGRNSIGLHDPISVVFPALAKAATAT